MPAGSQTIRELLVKIGVDADEATGGLKKVDDAFEDVKSAAQELIGVLAAVAAGAAAMAGIVVSEAAHVGESAKNIERQAAALGLTTDAYQELAYATGKYGLEAEDLADVFGQISQFSKAATDGSKESAAALDALGISTEALKGLSPADLFDRLADGIANTVDPTERLALASTILGEQAARTLGPLLLKGSAGLAALRKEAHRLGIVMDEEAIAKGVEFSAQLSELGSITTALRQEFALALIPTLTKLGTRFLAWYKINGDVIRQKIDEYATRIGNGFTQVADAITRADKAVGGAEGWARIGEILTLLGGALGAGYVATKVLALGSALWSLGSALLGLSSFLGPILTELGVMWSFFTASAEAGVLTEVLVAALGALISPVGLVVAAVGMLVASFAAAAAGVTFLSLLIEDFYTYVRGGDSVFGRLVAWLKESGGALAALGLVLEAVGNIFRALLDRLSADWAMAEYVLDRFGEAASRALSPAIALAEQFAAVLTDEVLAALNALAPGLAVLAAGLNLVAGNYAAETGARRAQFASAQEAGGLLAPSTASPSASLAPTSASAPGAGGAGTVTQTVGGDTNNFYGVGVTMEQVDARIAAQADAKRRKSMALFQNREV